MTNYYVDETGNYLGGFCGAPAPEGAVEISSPPEHGCDVLDHKTGQWDTSRRPMQRPTKTELSARLAAANSIAGIKQVLGEILDAMT